MFVRHFLQVLGAVFLIVGTSIGAGMLALPIATASLGLGVSTLLFVLIWILITLAAFLILEINLALPPGANLISMAHATLGRYGEAAAWVVYLFLLYALLSAYISGGSDLLIKIADLWQWQLSPYIAVFIFTAVLGFVVYLGLQSVEEVNTLLMLGKLSLFILLIVFILPYVKPALWSSQETVISISPLMVLVTSFGFAVIVPSLRMGFQDNIPLLRLALWIGSIIPLICYLLWVAVIMGVIPQKILMSFYLSGSSASHLSMALAAELHNVAITSLAEWFSAVTMLTAFLGIGLALSDFLADGLKLKKRGMQGVVIYSLTFLPPVAVVLFIPNVFMSAFNYAGIFCVFLLILLPLLMSYTARYFKQLSLPYRVPCGKTSLLIAMIAGMFLLIAGCFEQFGF